MVRFVHINDGDKLSRQLSGTAVQGQWGYENGYDATTGELKVVAVANASAAMKANSQLGLIMDYPVDIAGAESEHNALASGEMVIFVKAKGVEVEDDKLNSLSTTADWENAAYGADMVVNSEGYLTLAAAGDADTGAAVVAKFHRMINEIIFYETIQSATTAS